MLLRNWNPISYKSQLNDEINTLPHDPDFYLTILRKKAFKNIVGKGENAGDQHSPSPTMLSTYRKKNFFKLNLFCRP